MNVTLVFDDQTLETHKVKMKQDYSENQVKQDLLTLEIVEGSKLSSRFLTSAFKSLAKIFHPDKKGGTKEAFQNLQNAHNRLAAMVEDGNDESDENYEAEFFKKSNFPLEKKTCFVVILENKFADQWKHTIKDLYGSEKPLDNGGIQFKTKERQ